MVDQGTALELFKIGTGAVNNFLSNENVQALATFFGLTGYSLRDLKGLKGLYNFLGLYEKVFPNGLKTEKQKTILSDSFIELEDYIKNSGNFDDNVFEKIGALLIHGLENEDLLTREYIRILKQLTWIELQIFLESHDISHEKKSVSKETILSPIDILSEKAVNILVEKLNYPKELIQQIVNKLLNMNLFNKRGTGTPKGTIPGVRGHNNKGVIDLPTPKLYIVEYPLCSNLGEAIYNLIKKEF